jgi:hypothetical protein
MPADKTLKNILIFQETQAILRKPVGPFSVQGHLYEGFRIVLDRIRVGDDAVKAHVTVQMRLPVFIL